MSEKLKEYKYNNIYEDEKNDFISLKNNVSNIVTTNYDCMLEDVFDFELELTEETVLQELEEFEVLIEVELFAVHETKNKALSNINDNLFFIFLSIKDLF